MGSESLVFKHRLRLCLLITGQLAPDAREEPVIIQLRHISFPGSAAFWCLGHLATQVLLCVRALTWLMLQLSSASRARMEKYVMATDQASLSFKEATMPVLEQTKISRGLSVQDRLQRPEHRDQEQH